MQRIVGTDAQHVVGLLNWVIGDDAAVGAKAPLATLPAGPFGAAMINVEGWPAARYVFTKNDVDWTARLVEGEAGGTEYAHKAAVVWSLVNRFILFRRLLPFKTFADFLRKYSTTLQPYIMNPKAIERVAARPDARPVGGTFTVKGVEYPKIQTQRHLDLQRKPYGRVSAEARRVAERVLGGLEASPIGLASDFVGTHILMDAELRKKGFDPKKIPRDKYREQWDAFTRRDAQRKKKIWIGPEATSFDQLGQNVFYRDPRTINLQDDAVTITPPSE